MPLHLQEKKYDHLLSSSFLFLTLLILQIIHHFLNFIVDVTEPFMLAIGIVSCLPHFVCLKANYINQSISIIALYAEALEPHPFHF